MTTPRDWNSATPSRKPIQQHTPGKNLYNENHHSNVDFGTYPYEIGADLKPVKAVVPVSSIWTEASEEITIIEHNRFYLPEKLLTVKQLHSWIRQFISGDTDFSLIPRKVLQNTMIEDHLDVLLQDAYNPQEGNVLATVVINDINLLILPLGDGLNNLLFRNKSRNTGLYAIRRTSSHIPTAVFLYYLANRSFKGRKHYTQA
ncbi:hypothetical protein BDF14DRAFT_259450 [Spinellus fusiger]|nr:hypothetical protein BDF14DRAFT_259450 [Spinellus fusiger]